MDRFWVIGDSEKVARDEKVRFWYKKCAKMSVKKPDIFITKEEVLLFFCKNVGKW